MESWNHVINTALLGTEKRSLKEEDVDALLTESFALVAQQTTDREEVFLQQAALVYNYRQCGFSPLHIASATISQAENESQLYASPLAHNVLNDVLESGSHSLIQFWLQGCAHAEKIVHPEAIPVLFQVATKAKALQDLVTACSGKRGQWLRQFNNEWQWNELEEGEAVWQTGTLSHRKIFLAHIRNRDAANGLEY